jgi:hypothetical protein
MRAINNIMAILTIIVASPLGPCSKFVLLVSFEEFLHADHLGEPSYEEIHLIKIIFGALIITIIIFFFFTWAFFYDFLAFALFVSFEGNVLFFWRSDALGQIFDVIGFFNKNLMVDDLSKNIIRSHPLEGWILLNQGYYHCILNGISS